MVVSRCPSVFLMLVVGPSFLRLGLAFPCWSGVLALPSRNWLALPSRNWLALPSWGSGFRLSFSGDCWPSILGPVRLSHAGGWPFQGVVVGPSFLGFGLALPSWGVVLDPAFSEYVGPPLSGLGLACPSSGGNFSCLFGWEVVPSFLR